MKNNNLRKRFKFLQVLVAVFLCIFCSLTFVGCVGGGGRGGVASDAVGGTAGGTGGGSGGGSGGNSTPSTPTPNPPSADEKVTIDDYNDVFAGAIGVYDIGPDDVAFYDKYKGEDVSFNTLLDRQFETMATYLYNSLNRIYGQDPDRTLTSFDIFGYSSGGGTRQVKYDSVISDTNQKILSKLSTGILTNSDQLNYANAINGGYDLNILTEEGVDADGQPILNLKGYAYSATDLLDGTDGRPNYSWNGKAYFDKIILKQALIYIYLNQQTTNLSDQPISFADDSGDSVLKTYYSSFNFSNILSADISAISKLGISSQYLWNVAYFVGYSLIGRTNIDKSLTNHNTIFDGNVIKPIANGNCDQEIESAFESYKGYHVVIKELIDHMSQMSINPSDGYIVYENGDNWETTLFPALRCEQYIYYDTIEEVSDSNLEDGEYEDTEYTDKGSALKLKQVILFPYISMNNLSSFTVNGVVLSFMSKEGTQNSVEIDYRAVFDGSEESGSAMFVVGENDNDTSKRLSYDDKFAMSEDVFDTVINLNTPFESGETSFGNTYSVPDLMANSFRTVTKTINYEIAGDKQFTIGLLNVYNQLFNGSSELNVINNYLVLDFKFFDSAGQRLAETPETYLMFFYVYDN